MADNVVATPVAPQAVTSGASTPMNDAPKHRVKVDGREMEISHDELISGYQKSRSSDQRFQEAARKEKEVNDFFARAKEDPWSALEQLGIDADTAAEQRVLRKLELELMNPDAKKAYKAEQELSRLIKEREAENKAKQEQEAQFYQQQAVQNIDSGIAQAFQSKGVKMTNGLVRQVADKQLAYLNANGSMMPFDKALDMVIGDTKGSMAEYLSNMSIEEALQLLPPSFLDNIRKHQLKQLTQNKPFGMKASSEPRNPSTPVKKRVATSTDSFFTKLEKAYSK